MNKLAIRKSSWHYRLANLFGWSDMIKNPKGWERGEPSYTPNDDFCSYLRHVMLGVFVIGLCVALFVFYTYCNVLLFVAIFRHIFALPNASIRQAFAVVVDAFLLAVLACMLLWKLWFNWGVGEWVMDRLEAWRDRRYEKRRAKNTFAKPEVERDPFYRAAYASLKHKFCMKIEVTND